MHTYIYTYTYMYTYAYLGGEPLECVLPEGASSDMSGSYIDCVLFI
jgi:hypothetical protein